LLVAVLVVLQLLHPHLAAAVVVVVKLSKNI
jgi:hypothetical protein